MRYAVWVTHIDGRIDERSPRLVITNGPLHFGDMLPVANVGCWVTEIIEGEWTDDAGQVYDARAHAAAGPRRDPEADDE
jgi:hypothetical protein